MSLALAKVTPQVEALAQVLADRAIRLSGRVEEARRRLDRFSERLAELQERVEDAIARDLGYRGARPCGEPLAVPQPLPPLPQRATLIAADGSQIPPDRHAPALYYLINVGAILIRHGSGEAPETFIEPTLVYDPEEVMVSDEQPVTAGRVNARRDLQEITLLAELVWTHRHEAPVVALTDGGLLFWSALEGLSQREQEQYHRAYLEALTKVQDAGAALAGYVDRPLSTGVVSLLHLAGLERNRMSRAALSTHGPLAGVLDRDLFGSLLGPGERSALFVTMSPRNRDFKNYAASHEIHFFYLNVAPRREGAGQAMTPVLARVEVPAWVATDKALLAQVHALIYHQCALLAATPYPYILARADELAVIGGEEKRHLEMLIQMALRERKQAARPSAKAASKAVVRGQT